MDQKSSPRWISPRCRRRRGFASCGCWCGPAPDGMPAGEMAGAVGVSPSNVSFHLKELENAGLIEARREARSIIYSADYDTLRGLIGFLMKDCCAGHPEICAPVLADPCCAPAKTQEASPCLTASTTCCFSAPAIRRARSSPKRS